jgi:ribonuclease HI
MNSNLLQCVSDSHLRETVEGMVINMKKVQIYTDGACSGNPGPGGWGAILMYGEAEKELSGGEQSTTNNRMELIAVISALEALREPCEVELYTDSQYVSNAINLGWLESWRKKGWKRKGGEVKNPDLWIKLVPLLEMHDVTFIWVKGHAENEYNNRCDELAVEQSRLWRG